jgi:hypothetical protein
MLDVILVLMVFSNHNIEFLGSCGSHLEKGAGKWYRGKKRGQEGWVGPGIKMVSNDRYYYD